MAERNFQLSAPESLQFGEQMNDNRHWPDNTGYSQTHWKVTEKERKLYNDMRNTDPICPCDDCQRERDGEPEPNPLGFAFLLVVLFVLACVSFWRIFS